MPEINIDRLTLRLSGISEHDGQRLARLIAEGLTSSSIAAEGSHALDAMRVNVSTSPSSNVDMLSKQIVAEIVRQLESTL